MDPREQRRRKKALSRRRKLANVRTRRAAEVMRPDLSRNANVDRGREVTVQDVRIHALDGHPACRGSGMVSATQPCKCAQKRFFKAHPEIVVDTDGSRAWWPAKAVATEAIAAPNALQNISAGEEDVRPGPDEAGSAG